MTEHQGRFPSATGQHVFYRVWMPESEPKAVLQIIHGMAEHSARYAPFAEYMCKHGFIVAANDHPGHGVTGSEAGKTGYFDEKNGWNKVCQDLKRFNEQLREVHKLPVFILGHSMGSFFARCLMIRYPKMAKAWVLSGTGNFTLAERVGGFALANLSLFFKDPEQKAGFLHKLSFGAYNKKFKDEDSDFAWICSDKSVVEAYTKDPWCGFVASGAFYRDLLYGINIIHKTKELRKLPPKLPVLLISGKDDPVGNYGIGVKKVKRRFEKFGIYPDLMIYPDLRHEVLNEKGKALVWRDVLDFLERN
jgi:alpha-beta hydrolase superfamily lysophospholipase